MHKTPGVRLTLGIFSFIRTTMLTGSTNQGQFVSPLLAPESVAEALAEALYSGYGGTIYMPGIGQFVAVMVMMPAPSSHISVSIWPTRPCRIKGMCFPLRACGETQPLGT